MDGVGKILNHTLGSLEHLAQTVLGCSIPARGQLAQLVIGWVRPTLGKLRLNRGQLLLGITRSQSGKYFSEFSQQEQNSLQLCPVIQLPVTKSITARAWLPHLI
jgi:hypothetical protein